MVSCERRTAGLTKCVARLFSSDEAQANHSRIPCHSLKMFVVRVHSLYIIMQNEAGENVDLYVPRKCSWTSRLVEAKDHASVQINVANVDPVTGMATGESTPYCLCGYIRFKSEGDMALTALVEANDRKTMTVE